MCSIAKYSVIYSLLCQRLWHTYDETFLPEYETVTKCKKWIYTFPMYIYISWTQVVSSEFVSLILFQELITDTLWTTGATKKASNWWENYHLVYIIVLCMVNNVVRYREILFVFTQPICYGLDWGSCLSLANIHSHGGDWKKNVSISLNATHSQFFKSGLIWLVDWF